MNSFRAYTLAIVMLFCLNIAAQNSVNSDPETIQNSIEYNISQAQEYVDNSDFKNALEKLNEALKQANEIQNNKAAGFIEAKIGKLHYLVDQPQQALKALTKALETQRLAEDNSNLSQTYLIFGDVYAKMGNASEALEHYTLSQTLLEKEKPTNNKRLAKVFYTKGKLQATTQDYGLASLELEKAIELSRSINANAILGQALLEKSKLLTIQNNVSAAKETAVEALTIAEQNKFVNLKKEALLTLSNINSKLKNFEASTSYLQSHLALSDSIQSAKKNALTVDEKLAANTVATTLIEESKEDLANLKPSTLGKLTTILSIALITILSLLTLSLYKNNNIRLKTNNILYKKNDELVAAKERAELATKTKANFLSTVTHELRTPLYAVIGLTNMLLEENPRPEQIQHLKSLKFSGDYLLNFINDILQLNKIEANKVSLDPEIFNLKKKTQNVINALNNSAVDNNVKLHFEFDPNLPETYNADQLKISQILINLIGNSIKFTKDGDIWIRVKKQSEDNGVFNIRFEVEDNGIGISKEKQESLFESFNQGSVQINRKYGGTGLGLSIVKGLIDILKGQIHLKSELGKGSNFYFDIPLQYSKQVAKEVKQSYFEDMNELQLNQIKILVVEDNKINQMITKKILNKMGLQCDIVDNGEEAVDNVKNNIYDVVLMDIHMPGISGIEATKIIRTFDKELTIFALTAVTIDDKMHEFEEAGFDDIISKPFKQEDFEKKLFNALSEGDKLTPATPAV